MWGAWRLLRRIALEFWQVGILLVYTPVQTSLLALFCLGWIASDQANEVIRSYMEPEPIREQFWRAAWSVILFNILWVLYTFETWLSHTKTTQTGAFAQIRLSWWSRLPLALLPSGLACAIGVKLLGVSRLFERGWLVEAAALAVGIIWLLTMAAIWGISLRARSRYLDAFVRHFLIVLMPLLAIVMTIWLSQTAISNNYQRQEYDVLFYVVMWISCLTIVFGALTIAVTWTTFPAGAVLVICVSWLGFLGWNNLNYNYKLDRGRDFISPEPREGQALKPALDAFKNWLMQRPNLDAYDRVVHGDQAPRYPLVLVAAQGGGTYAGYHVALFLARLQDKNPKFVDHLFAISGVSGGALGSAVFTAAQNMLEGRSDVPARRDGNTCDTPRRPYKDLKTSGPREQLVACLFRFDLLSPVVGRGLFHDTWMAWVPSIFWTSPALTRSAAFSLGLEEAWSRVAEQYGGTVANRKFFSSGTLAYWNERGNLPLLLMNATVVTDASRLIMSPVTWEEKTADSLNAHAWIDVVDGDIKISTAITLSSGFPVVFPPIEVDRSDGGKMRIVDGGYAENSGLATITLLLQTIAGNNGQQLLAPIDLDDGNGRQKSIALDIYIVTFTHRVREFEAFHSGSMFAEFLDPIRAIVNARVQRGIETLELSKLAFKNGITILPVVLGDSAFTPPLGLVLSPSALERIERRSGFHELTAIEKLGESAAGWRSVEENNASAHKLWEITK